jgi:uncharacterized protein (TIGR03437 family)
MLLWLLLLSAVSLSAAISNVQVIGSTNVQSLIGYQAPDSGACTLEVSENPDFQPLVKDVDPSLFPGASSDSRPGNISQGAGRMFIAGKRGVDRASDGKWYSRALQADTPHYFRIHCGSDTAVGTFRTANIPVGVTYPWPLPQDPATGNYRWPSTDGNDRNQTLIDPNYGSLIRRVSAPGDSPTAVDSLQKPFGSAAGANWTNAAAALKDDGAVATYSGTAQDWLALTSSALLNLADFYVYSAGLDSIAVRIKGSAQGDTAGRTIDVCLTFDGATCSGAIREAVLDTNPSVQTLGGGPPIDVWGNEAVHPSDLARNKNFGVMIRASSPGQASLSIDYVEIDAAFSDFMYTPESGFQQVCSAIPSNGGYHCTFVSSVNTNHLYWIHPGTGEVRWLGKMVATNWGGQPQLCGSSYAYFDTTDPNVYYCEGHLDDGRSLLLKGTYTGNDAPQPPGTIAPFQWVNLTPPGNTVGELIRQFDPSYDPSQFPPSLGLMTNHYFVYRAWRQGQDSRAWLAVLDLGNGQPIGSGGTGKIVAATKTWEAPGTRWCGLHTVEFTGHRNWFGWDATTMMSGGSDGTGPFTVKLVTPLPASEGQFTIQVSGEPQPYVMDAAVGDTFELSGTPWPGFDFLTVLQKLSPTQWVVKRTVTKPTPVVAQAAGTAMYAFCGARQLTAPTQGIYVYWDFLNDARARDTSGTHWVLEKQMTGGHITQRGNYRIMEASDGYSVIGRPLERSFNRPRDYHVPGNPPWRSTYANAMGEGLGNGFMQHESYENYAATGPGRSNWFVDMVPFIGTTTLVPAVQAVGGQVYRVAQPKIHPDIFPTFALCGGRQLKDISPGPIAGKDTDSFCVGSSCAAGASSSDVFVNCPPPASAKSTCTAFPGGDSSSICVGDMTPFAQAVTQHYLDSSGLRNRVLTNALYAWHSGRTFGYFDTAYSLPDGSWVIFASWGNNGRKDLYMVKVPAQPGFPADPKAGQQPVMATVSANPPSGASQTLFQYGDSGSLGSSTPAQSCSNTCSVTLPAVPGSVLVAQPQFQGSTGPPVAGPAMAQAPGGISGSGVGKPQLASGNAVLNAFSFLPQVAPGAIVSIFGENLADCEAQPAGFPLPTTLCNAGVAFNGQPAFLFYAGPNQINAEMPSTVAPNKDTPVVVTRDGAPSDAFTLPAAAVGDVAPAMAQYTADGQLFRAIVQNPDNSIAGPARPLKKGETGVLYATALGPTTPPVADGQPAPRQPLARTSNTVEVYVNGTTEPVTYSGLTPDASALYQVNFTLDPATPLKAGDNNFIWLKVNGVEGPHVLVSVE